MNDALKLLGFTEEEIETALRRQMLRHIRSAIDGEWRTRPVRFPLFPERPWFEPEPKPLQPWKPSKHR